MILNWLVAKLRSLCILISKGYTLMYSLTYLRCDCISISLRSWCSTEALWSWDLKRTLRATTNLLVFSLARYTLPNFPSGGNKFSFIWFYVLQSHHDNILHMYEPVHSWLHLILLTSSKWFSNVKVVEWPSPRLVFFDLFTLGGSWGALGHYSCLLSGRSIVWL